MIVAGHEKCAMQQGNDSSRWHQENSCLASRPWPSSKLAPLHLLLAPPLPGFSHTFSRFFRPFQAFSVFHSPPPPFPLPSLVSPRSSISEVWRISCSLLVHPLLGELMGQGRLWRMGYEVQHRLQKTIRESQNILSSARGIPNLPRVLRIQKGSSFKPP